MAEQEHFGTNGIRTLANRRAFTALLDQAIVSAATFAMTIVLERLGGSTLANYYLAWSVAQIVYDAISELIANPYTVLCHRDEPDARARYLGSVYVHLSVGCLAVSILFLLGSALIEAFGYTAPLPRGLLIITLLTASSYILRQFLRSIFFSESQPTRALALDVLCIVPQLGALMYLQPQGSNAVELVLLIIAGANLFASLLSLWMSAPPATWQRSRLLSDWLRNWTFSKWTTVTFLFENTISWVVPWSLWYLGDLRGIEAIGLSATLIGCPGVCIRGLRNHLLPPIYAAKIDGEANTLWQRVRDAAWLLPLPAALFLGVIACTQDFIPTLCFRDRGIGVGPVLMACLLAQTIGASGIAFTAGLWTYGRQRDVTLIGLIATAISLLSLVLLLPALGALGAGLANVVNHTVGTIARFFLLARVRNEKLCPDNINVIMSTE